MFRVSRKLASFSSAKENPFNKIVQTINAGGKTHKYFGLAQLNDPRLGTSFITKTTCPSVSECCWRVLSGTATSSR